jgi:pyruvate dehydrogenase E1 component
MPDFWQFPTVSMGLGPIMAIYQARFNRYLEDRGLADPPAARSGLPRRRRDRRAREPRRHHPGRSREQLDNLIFVVNCNLQRLDGPVRGNGKIIQELEPPSAAPAGTSSR